MWLLLLLLPVAALAAVQGDIDLTGLPWKQILGSGFVCLWGSMARTSRRALLAGEHEGKFDVWYELWRDARRSSVIGAVVYLSASGHGWDAFQLGGALFVAGYMGPLALDMITSKGPGV